MTKVKEVEVHALESDAEFAKNEGKFFEVQKDITIYNDDVDIYAIAHPDDVAAGKPKRKLLAKFRKSVFTAEQVQVGWDAFRLLAMVFPSLRRLTANSRPWFPRPTRSRKQLSPKNPCIRFLIRPSVRLR